MKKRDLSNIDWTKSNSDLAREMGLTNQMVILYRRRVGIPAPRRFEHLKRDRKRVVIDPGLTASENAEVNGVTSTTIRKRCERDGIILPRGGERSKKLREQANWFLPDSILGYMFGLSPVTVRGVRERSTSIRSAVSDASLMREIINSIPDLSPLIEAALKKEKTNQQTNKPTNHETNIPAIHH